MSANIMSAQEHGTQFGELKKAQARLKQARYDYEHGFVERSDYILETECCIKAIKNYSRAFAKPIINSQ